MPKVEKQVGDDPDPAEWLFISLEQKRIDQSKPYDAKKACWVPCEKEGYVLGEIKSTKGELVSVSIPGGEVKSSIAQLQSVSCPLNKQCPKTHTHIHTYIHSFIQSIH